MSGAITITGDGPLKELKSQIRVGPPLTDYSGPPPLDRLTDDVTAIWDTGATGSVITQAIVDALGIAPITYTNVHGVSGIKLRPVFLVDFHFLEMRSGITGLNVTLGELPGDAKALIGMDVISAGDFVVSNRGGKTKMSFRVPSEGDWDFVDDINRASTGGGPVTRQQRREQQRRAAKDAYKRNLPPS